jgi:hypothetical protein
MAFTRYRTVKELHVGAIRTTLQPGEVVEFDGNVALVRGQERSIPGLANIIGAGLLVPEGQAEMVVAKTEPTQIAIPIPLPRPPPEKKEVAADNPDKPHVWEADLFANGQTTCKVCGVTRTGGSGWGNIQVDKPSMPWQYTDAYNNTIMSLHELPCPTFIGQTNGAVMGVKVDVRRIKGTVSGHGSRLDSVEDRMAYMEAENVALREELERRQQVDIGRLTSWFVSVVNKAREIQGADMPMLEDRMFSDVIEGIIDVTPEKVAVTEDQDK